MVQFIITSSPYVAQGEPKELSVSLLDDNGIPVNNANILFKVLGTTWKDINQSNNIKTHDGVANSTYTPKTAFFNDPTITLTAITTVNGTRYETTQEITTYTNINDVPPEYYMKTSSDVPVRIEFHNGTAQLILNQNIPEGNYTIRGRFIGSATLSSATDEANLTITSNIQENVLYQLTNQDYNSPLTVETEKGETMTIPVNENTLSQIIGECADVEVDFTTNTYLTHLSPTAYNYIITNMNNTDNTIYDPETGDNVRILYIGTVNNEKILLITDINEYYSDGTPLTLEDGTVFNHYETNT